MKRNLIFFITNILVFCAGQSSLNGHGFGAHTLVHIAHNNEVPIKKLCKQALREKIYIFSATLTNNQLVPRLIKSVGKSIADRVLWLEFDNDSSDPIVCTPLQTFYVPHRTAWVRAHDLHVGDYLMTKCGQPCQLTKKEMINRPTKVYGITVAIDHTFFVGKRMILTHNMFLPAVTLGLGAAFGSGATTGGVTGCFLGPIGITCGVVVGGLVGMTICACIGHRKIPTYAIDCNQARHEDIKEKKPRISEPGQGRDTGAQAPGKPRAEDGYEPPKNWDGKKVRHKRGFGYPDKKKSVWIPTGPKGHGDPHWDVQHVDGTYDNIMPGGHKRGEGPNNEREQ